MHRRRHHHAIPLLAGLMAWCGAAAAEVEDPRATTSDLRPSEAQLTLDYQTIRVPGDAPIDLMGFHVGSKINDWLALGTGVYAPMHRGEYGGFMAFDVGIQVRRRLAGPLYLSAGLSGGGGGGGRSIEQSRVLSGTGGFVRGYAGLGVDFGSFSLGAHLTTMKFRHSAIHGTQANVFLEIPYTYLSGPFARHGQPLSADDDRLAASDMGENQLTLAADSFRQIRPIGSNKGLVRVADLQFSHFVAKDTYWFAALGVGYRGLPIYNQMLGGIGQRVHLSPRLSASAQLGVGSGGYAPEIIDTAAGLLVYPKVTAEYAVTRNLGLSVSAGYLAAPTGSSRNRTFGLALAHHLRSGAESAESTFEPARWRGYRLSLFQQTETQLRYRDIARDSLQLVGVQVDMPLDARWYLPVQAAVAYDAYLGYPGYGEILAGVGLQEALGAGERFQGFVQLMGGSNVHGTAAKLATGVRYVLDDRLSIHGVVGHIEARGSSGQRFRANSVGLGLDYHFAVPVR